MYYLSGCFSCCMESGVRIYNVEPLVEKCHYGKVNVSQLQSLKIFCRHRNCGKCGQVWNAISHQFNRVGVRGHPADVFRQHPTNIWWFSKEVYSRNNVSVINTGSADEKGQVKSTNKCSNTRQIDFFCRIIVALLTSIHVFSFPAPTQRLFSLETIRNPRGLLELSPLAAGEKQIIIFPGHKVGSVQILVNSTLTFFINYQIGL